MGDDDLHTSIGHLILAVVSGHDLSRWHAGSFSHPGVHGNYFIHGIFGFLHYQNKVFNLDMSKAFLISFKATKYLALPCLMADLYRSDNLLCYLHLASGIIPFTLFLSKTEDEHLGNLMIAINIVSLCYYSHQHNRQWGWYTAAASAFAYFVTPQMGHRIFYPLSLALVEYCAYRVFAVHFSSGSM